MNYLISLKKPILHIWSGNLIKEAGTPWQHQDKRHDADFEFTMLEKGTLYLEVNNHPITLKAGQALLVPPFGHIRGIKPTDEEISQYWLHFFADYQEIDDRDPLIQKATGQHQQLGELPSVNDFAILPALYSLHNSANIFLLFRQLLQSVNGSPYSQRQNDFFVSYLLCEISSDYLQGLRKMEPSDKFASTTIAEWTRASLSSSLTVKQIADNFHLNASYLSRMFKREMGIPLKSYIIDMKIEYAKYFLVSTNLLVAEVAEQAHFADVKQFLHTFKNRTGVTPSEFRDSMSKTRMSSNLVDPKSNLPAEYGTKAIHV